MGGKRPKAAARICAEKVEYFENPFGKPLNTREEIIKTWSEVPQTQKDIKFKYDIVTVNNEFGRAHWEASLIRIPSGKKDKLDGIFIVYLNSKGLCIKFRQWWVIK